MIDDFIGGKHGRKPIRKLHPLVDDVLKPTYGVPVYQEQVMQIAQHLAGYSLGGADLLRRAMGKKKAEEMAKQQDDVRRGRHARTASSEEQADAIFKEMEGFASYGFNKSHSAAYALVTYQTAYLKAHYPAEFFAALMTADKDKIEKVVRIIAEARAWGVSVLPPDINMSEIDFTVVYAHPDGSGPPRGPGKLARSLRAADPLRPGSGSRRGRERARDGVRGAHARADRSATCSTSPHAWTRERLNKGVLEALVQCGAFDSSLAPIGISRARAYAAVDRALERSRSASRDRERGQTTLFGLFEAARERGRRRRGRPLDEYPAASEWDSSSCCAARRRRSAATSSGHPLLRYGSKLGAARRRRDRQARRARSRGASCRVAGMVENYQERIFRGGSGGKAAFFEIEDMSGRVEAKLRGDRIETYAHLLTGGEAVLDQRQGELPDDRRAQRREGADAARRRGRAAGGRRAQGHAVDLDPARRPNAPRVRTWWR